MVGYCSELTAAMRACKAGGILVTVPPGVGMGPLGLGWLIAVVSVCEVDGEVKVEGKCG